MIHQTEPKALGDIGPAAKPAVPALIRAVHRRDDAVGTRAAEALGQIEAKEAAPELSLVQEARGKLVRRAVALTLVRLGEEPEDALMILTDAMKGNDERVRGWAATELVRRGAQKEEALTILIGLTKPAEKRGWEYRRLAVVALGLLGPDAKSAVPAASISLKGHSSDTTFMVSASAAPNSSAVNE